MLKRLFGRRPTAQNRPDHAGLTSEDHAKLGRMMALVGDQSQPNINRLIELARNVDILALNVKALGYDLARTMSQALPPPSGTTPRHVGLASKLATQADIASDWAAHWFGELGIAPFYHRKLWEFAFLLQALHEAAMLAPGRRGLGFGCGVEPTPSYFAARGMDVTMTDLFPEDERAREWSDTNQHAASLEQARAAHLVDQDTFARRVAHRYVDMNDIPDDLRDYDFCWSLCAVEHLGSIAQGLAFLENSLRTLRPGGVSVHTVEFNMDPDGPTIDNWPTVLFQRRHFEDLAARLAARGHHVASFDFEPGNGPLDHFIDLPPWHSTAKGKLSEWLGPSAHIKVAVDGFVSTCFGIIITKSAAE